jgi:hypothetical protein
MAIGIKEKDGVIIHCTDGFNYYNGLSDSSLRPVYRPRDNATVRTMKSYEVVSVANNVVSVTVYPDGKVLVEPSKSV